MARSIGPVTRRRSAVAFAVVATLVLAMALSLESRAAPAPVPLPSSPAGVALGSPATPAPSAGLRARAGAASAVGAATFPMQSPGVPVVPIVGFWSTARSLSTSQLRAALAGQDRQFRLVVVGAPDLAVLAAALDVRPGPTTRELTTRAVLEAVQGHVDVLGLVRANDVRPSVRALAVDGRALFGNARVGSLAEWPLTVPATAPPGTSSRAPRFDPTAAWTLVAAGDVMNDREVYRRTVVLGRGPDFPWNGGTARIVRRTCCSVGLPIVTATRTGSAGAVRALFRDADLAIVNHEGPAPDHFAYHPTGLTFTFDPRLEAGLSRAGVDVVSLANNHIRNAGSTGVVQTLRNVKAAGLVPVGAGRNVTAARKPAWIEVHGVRVAIFAYDAVDLYAAGATDARPGAAPLQLGHARADIRAARAAGADVVIVVPHWGVEYTSRPTALQRRQAAALIADGADVVLGSHPHWAGAIEAIGDGIVVYSMGDFIFDLPRSEQTDEGLIVELTFAGRHLAQLDIHPTIEIDRSQPNLLDPGRDGRVVLDRVRDASRGILGW